MKANELINALKCHIARHGDCNVEISITKPKVDECKDQGYLTSEPTFCVFEEGEDGKVVAIRDWPY